MQSETAKSVVRQNFPEIWRRKIDGLFNRCVRRPFLLRPQRSAGGPRCGAAQRRFAKPRFACPVGLVQPASFEALRRYLSRNCLLRPTLRFHCYVVNEGSGLRVTGVTGWRTLGHRKCKTGKVKLIFATRRRELHRAPISCRVPTKNHMGNWLAAFGTSPKVSRITFIIRDLSEF
jgi:hypothetical protein